jgi:hypothetical protein
MLLNLKSSVAWPNLGLFKQITCRQICSGETGPVRVEMFKAIFIVTSRIRGISMYVMIGGGGGLC